MLYKRNPQLNKNGELIHLLSIEGLPKDILTHILDTASQFVSACRVCASSAATAAGSFEATLCAYMLLQTYTELDSARLRAI